MPNSRSPRLRWVAIPDIGMDRLWKAVGKNSEVPQKEYCAELK